MLYFTEELKSRLEAYTFMCKHGKQLRADKDFGQTITITHLDGSKFYLPNSSWDEDEKRIFVWTEHCGYLYFYKDDLEEMDIREEKWDEEQARMVVVEHTITKFNVEVKPNEAETEETQVGD